MKPLWAASSRSSAVSTQLQQAMVSFTFSAVLLIVLIVKLTFLGCYSLAMGAVSLRTLNGRVHFCPIRLQVFDLVSHPFSPFFATNLNEEKHAARSHFCGLRPLCCSLWKCCCAMPEWLLWHGRLLADNDLRMPTRPFWGGLFYPCVLAASLAVSRHSA